MKLAYRLYQLPKSDKKNFRPYTCYELFILCRDGKYETAEVALTTAEKIYKATLSELEKFDDLIDRMG